MSSPTDSSPKKTRLSHQPSRPEHRNALGASLIALFLLIALISTVLEYFGVINLLPNFGRRGRPYIELGVWQPAEFTDIPEDFWASEAIEELVDQGVIKGFPNREFRPNQPITRAEFAVMVQAAFNQTPTPNFMRSIQATFNSNAVQLTGGFRDISSDFWAASAIANTAQSNFFNGFPNNEFRPDEPISKVNALVAIANGLGLDSDGATRDSLWYYRDADQIPEYAKNDVAAATEARIYLSRLSEPTFLQPTRPLTRAEAANLIQQALRHMGQ
ncbi:S-layer homology domain-containing protein [Oculatella sp. LEGE 06141]|uniref:S-layer homology domain-containing protein n=1 Tax=Oculatella sp. LEGE 06141 TaxID=1828648 RepID=UPI001882BCE1|nr:S-layer homology domain-containing protein [Oculatella sp. LEGE 06141]MBE9182494.1 S-layer homology domain-containing protein [Oculatella sp. LEGE 06141]